MVIGRPWPKRLFSSQIRTALSAKAVAGCDMMRAWAPKLPGRGCASSNTTARGRKLRVQVGIAGEQEGPGVRGVAVAGLGRRRPPAAWRLLHLKGPHAAESVTGPARGGCGAFGTPNAHACPTPRRAGQPVGRGMVGLPDGVLAGRVLDDRHAAGGSGQRRLRHSPVNGWLVSGGRGPTGMGRSRRVPGVMHGLVHDGQNECQLADPRPRLSVSSAHSVTRSAAAAGPADRTSHMIRRAARRRAAGSTAPALCNRDGRTMMPCPAPGPSYPR